MTLIIGIDGEGKDLSDGSHVYTLLSAVDEYGNVIAEIENQDGLSTKDCLDMLVSLPEKTLKFIFMGSYDWTKIIEQLSLADRYTIMHPETRRVRFCSECREVRNEKECPECGNATRNITRHCRTNGYQLDWFNGSFTVGRKKKRVKVWDVFKFFQCSFVKALENWTIGTPEQRGRILAMKKKRGAFAKESPDDVRHYCREECHLLALMMREVIEACKKAGIDLLKYHGAGSIASALMHKHSTKKFLGPSLEELPGTLAHAIMSAYFGGRFENSVVGAVTQKVYNRDIFSAYPYAIEALPCLAHGRWKHVTKNVMRDARKATLAVVHFRVRKQSVEQRQNLPWAPLPCREQNGSICFPTGFEGWAWLPELEAALKGWPDLVEVLDCWTFTSTCDHKPFAWIPEMYRRRFEWSKDGRGIVVKLGMNAIAGKTMQNEGDPPPYKSWIWGGMITATTRSQALEAICAAKNRWNVLAVATDGIFTTERLKLPKPRDTGTNDLAKPLGGWGSDEHPNGVFFVKPGMYFDDAGSLMRARGIGRDELDARQREIVAKFKRWDRKSELKIRAVSRRFYGARSSVLMFSQCTTCNVGWPGMPAKRCPKCGRVGDRANASEMKLKDKKTSAYGRWAERPIDIEFEPLPKRESIAQGGNSGRMRVRDLDGVASVPYSPGVTTPLGVAARAARDEALEEPDWSDEDHGG